MATKATTTEPKKTAEILLYNIYSGRTDFCNIHPVCPRIFKRAMPLE